MEKLLMKFVGVTLNPASVGLLISSLDIMHRISESNGIVVVLCKRQDNACRYRFSNFPFS